MGIKGQIVYVKGVEKSETMASESLESFKKHGWTDIELVEGFTPHNLDETNITEYNLIPGTRLHHLFVNKSKIFYIKLATISNHIKFWNKVILENEPMAFIEHDAICINKWNDDLKVDEYVLMNHDHESFPFLVEHVGCIPTDYVLPKKDSGIYSLPNDWGWVYREGPFFNSKMGIGTASYIITPKGAKKMLDVFENKGIDQIDMILNSNHINIEYITPRLVDMNKNFMTLKTLHVEDYYDRLS